MIEIKKGNPELWKYVDSLEDHLEVIYILDSDLVWELNWYLFKLKVLLGGDF